MQALHELFEAQVERTPDAVALECGGKTWTYDALNRDANRLAHYLRSLGVAPETPVAICLERSAEAIVAIFAVLKAGVLYLPLDPSYPVDGLVHVLSDSQAPLLLTQRRLARNLPTGDARAIYVEEIAPAIAAQPSGNPSPTAGLRSAAYMIYTSGSSGRPKGVIVEHENAIHSTWSRLRYYEDEPVTKFAFLFSLSFDASIAGIFWTLSSGGTLCVAETGAERNVSRLADWIWRHQISHCLSIPSLYQLLLEQPIDRLASLKVTIVGGENCSQTLVARHRALLPGALYNEYGPTEAAVWSTVYACGADRPDGVVPIGRPIHNMRAYILDAMLNPAPIGVPGELCLAGAGVARGYLRRPELTAEKFIVDPFDPSGGRMYRTGDLVRYLPDGNIEFLGRIDNQIKIRGYRIELGQIEAALRRDPGLVEAVVLAQQVGGSKHLVAYFVPRETPYPTPQKLRHGLRDRLPEYMIPTYFVALDALPLTPHGKINRLALPLPDRASMARQRNYVTPVDEIEKRVAMIWERVFDLKPIGACDDFFDLGGDSLLAAGLFARIEHEFGRAISLDLLLERPTVRDLAEMLRNPTSLEQFSVVTIQAGDARTPLFCLPGIGGNVLEFRELARRLDPGQPVYGLRPAGLDDGQAPHQDIAEMAAYGIEQMRSVQPHGPYYLAGYSLGGVVAFEMAHQLRAAGEELSLLALLDSRMWSPPVRLSLTQKLRLHWQTLARSSNAGRWHYLRERGRLLAARIRRGNLRGAEDDVVVGLDLAPSSRVVARAHWQAWRTYEPRVYDGSIVLFVAQQHPDMAAAVNGHDPTQDWSRWTSRTLESYPVAGTHAEVLRSMEPGLLQSRLTPQAAPSSPMAGDASGETN